MLNNIYKEAKKEELVGQEAKFMLNDENFVFKEFINEKGKVEFKDKADLEKFGKQNYYLEKGVNEYRAAGLEEIKSLANGQNKDFQNDRLSKINEYSKIVNPKFKEFTAPPNKDADIATELRYQDKITPKKKTGVSAAHSQAAKIVANIRHKFDKNHSQKSSNIKQSGQIKPDPTPRPETKRSSKSKASGQGI